MGYNMISYICFSDLSAQLQHSHLALISYKLVSTNL